MIDVAEVEAMVERDERVDIAITHDSPWLPHGFISNRAFPPLFEHR